MQRFLQGNAPIRPHLYLRLAGTFLRWLLAMADLVSQRTTSRRVLARFRKPGPQHHSDPARLSLGLTPSIHRLPSQRTSATAAPPRAAEAYSISDATLPDTHHILTLSQA